MKNLKRNPLKKLLAVATFVGAASSSAIAAPRTLANGAPACGNTFGKAPCTAESANEMYQARVERVRGAEKAVQAARARLHEATRKVALQKQRGESYAFDAHDDDYS